MSLFFHNQVFFCCVFVVVVLFNNGGRDADYTEPCQWTVAWKIYEVQP